MGLAATDEDRGPAIAVTRRAAALLAAELLAGAGDIRTLTGGAGGAAALLELPGDDAVQDVGARLNGENLVLELDVAAGLAAVEVLNLDLHDLAFLAFVGRRLDRKSVVSGKSVSVRVDLGGRRFIKKKKESIY